MVRLSTTAALCCASLLHVLAQAPYLRFTGQQEGHVVTRDLAILPDCDIVQCGILWDPCDLDPGPSQNTTVNGYHSFVQKLDPAGQPLWSAIFRIVSPAADEFVLLGAMVVDQAGFIYVTIDFHGSFDVDPGPGQVMLSDNGWLEPAQDVAVVKLDPAGALVWARQLVGTAGSTYGDDLTYDETVGGLFLVGTYGGTVDFDPGVGSEQHTAVFSDQFVMRLDAEGVLQWWRPTCSGTNGTIGCHTAANGGVVFVCGTTIGPNDLDPGPGVIVSPLGPFQSNYISRFDADGAFMGTGIVSSAFILDVSDMDPDHDGGAILYGCSTEAIDLDPQAGSTIVTPIGADGMVGFVAAYTTGGSLAWARQLRCSGSVRRIHGDQDGDGGVWMLGNFSDAMDIDPGPGTDMVSTLGGQEAFVLALDPDHDLHFSMRFVTDPPTSLGTTGGDAIGVDEDGAFWCTGHFAAPFYADPPTDQVLLSPDISGVSYYLNQYTPDHVDPWPPWAELCEGSCQTLQISTQGPGPFQFEWAPPLTSQVGPGPVDICPTTSGLYACIISAGCTVGDTNSMWVEVLPSPIVDLGPDTMVCPGSTVILTNANTSGSAVWSDGSGGPDLSISADTWAWLEVTSSSGCAARDSCHVIVPEEPPWMLPETLPTCFMDDPHPILLTAGSFALAYLWSTGSSSPAIEVSAIGAYSVRIIDDLGCSYEHQVLLTDECEALYVPNAFTPDHDGTNDVFAAQGNGLAELHIDIFDRWGVLIHAITGLLDDWDGTIHGVPAPPGAYAWRSTHVPVMRPEDGPKTRTGHLILIR